MISSIASSSVSQTHQRPKPEDIFQKMDSDGDGSVSKQEFESAFVQISQKGGQAADGANAKAKADELYAKMDSDGDGKLSASEFETAAKAHEAQRGQGGSQGSGGGALAAGGSEKSTDPADTNQDGVVSAQEAAAYQATQQAQEAIEAYASVQASS